VSKGLPVQSFTAPGIPPLQVYATVQWALRAVGHYEIRLEGQRKRVAKVLESIVSARVASRHR